MNIIHPTPTCFANFKQPEYVNLNAILFVCKTVSYFTQAAVAMMLMVPYFSAGYPSFREGFR